MAVKHDIGIGQLADFCGNRTIFPVLNRSTFLITRPIFTDATRANASAEPASFTRKQIRDTIFELHSSGLASVISLSFENATSISRIHVPPLSFLFPT